jgi:hypothetical protein
MAQLTVYLDDGTLKKVGMAARREHRSISQWVKQRLVGALSHTWPAGYFELFGSLADESFERPPQPSLSRDVRRTAL